MRKTKGKIVLSVLLFSILFSGCARKSQTVADVRQTVEIREEEETKEKKEGREGETKSLSETTISETEIRSQKETKEEDLTQCESEEEEGKVPDRKDGQVVETKEMGYTITQMEEVRMYASAAVNVREGPSTDFERVGALRAGQEVRVTGETSTGWYEIAYNETVGYVSDKYLQAEPLRQTEPAASSNIAGNVDTTNVILIGDSRTAEMKNCAGENACVWIADFAKGISWFASDAVPTADPYIGQGTKVIINLGANDPDKIDTYIYKMNEVCTDWIDRGAVVYYATVGPCNENPYHTNDEAVEFNASLQNGITAGVQWIDLYGYLVNNGFATREDDGFHYDTSTYSRIYAYYMSCIG